MNSTNKETQSELRFGPQSYVNPSKAISCVTVQTRDLLRLKHHLNNINLEGISTDWNAIFIGGFFSSIIPFIYEWIKGDSFPTTYAIISMILLVCAYIATRKQSEKTSIAVVSLQIGEAKTDLSDILEKANVSEEDNC